MKNYFLFCLFLFVFCNAIDPEAIVDENITTVKESVGLLCQLPTIDSIAEEDGPNLMTEESSTVDSKFIIPFAKTLITRCGIYIRNLGEYSDSGYGYSDSVAFCKAINTDHIVAESITRAEEPVCGPCEFTPIDPIVEEGGAFNRCG